MHPGLIGGIIGGVLGLAGGVIGTWMSVKYTKSPGEKAFMVKTGVIFWIAVIVFVALLLALPSPYRYFLWIPYSILLPLGIIKGNKIQQRIRREESEKGG